MSHDCFVALHLQFVVVVFPDHTYDLFVFFLKRFKHKDHFCVIYANSADHRTWHLIKVVTVCLQNRLLYFEELEIKTAQPLSQKYNSPTGKSGKVHLA